MAAGHRIRRHGPGRSAGDCRKADGGIIAQRCDGFQCHVASALDGPFVVLFEEDGSHKTDDGVLVGEDADDISASLDLTVEALDRVGGVQLGTVLGWESHVGKHVRLGLIEEYGELWQLGA